MLVAILEDDTSQAELLHAWLSATYCPRLFATGAELLHAMQFEKFDALILDWNLPDISGIEILQRVLRSSNPNVPVLFSTARGAEEDVFRALRAGADDYVVKPVRRNELLARLDAVMGRNRDLRAAPAIIELDRLTLDRAGRRLLCDGVPLTLTAKDFDLAAYLLTNIGRLASRQQIVEAVWGKVETLASRTLDTHVSRVRKRVGLTAKNGWELRAVYGLGYRLDRTKAPAGPRQTDQQFFEQRTGTVHADSGK